MYKKYLLFTFFFISSLASALPAYWQQHDSFVRAGIRHTNAWYEVSDEQKNKHFGRRAESMGRVSVYRPAQCNNGAKPVVFFLVHGTWARGAYDFEDERSSYFQMSKHCAAELAVRTRTPVEFVSFRWPGGDTFQDRNAGGRTLSKVLMHYYGPNNSYGGTHFLAHSHGCNVVSLALHTISFPVDTLFYIAAPVIEATECGYRPTQFRTLYNLYSTSDPVQFLGAFNRRSSTKFFTDSLARMYEQQEGRRVFNVRVKIDGVDPGHIHIKRVAPSLWSITDQVSRHYRYHHDFIVDVTNRVRRKRLHHTRPLLVIETKVKKMTALSQIADTPNAARVAQMILDEFRYSSYQEEQYIAAYRGRMIQEQSTWFQAIMENWRELRIIFREIFGDADEKKNSLLEPVIA